MASLRFFFPSEDANWSERLFDLVTILFRGAGRIRFKLDFEGDEILSDTLRRELHKVHSVTLASYSVRTRSALVTYDAKHCSEIDVVVALFRGIREFARIHGECDLNHHHHSLSQKQTHDHHDECAHDHTATSTDAGIRKEVMKLALTGGALFYLVYRKLSGKSDLLASNPLGDLASLITILSGYPIFRAGFSSVSNRKKATDDTLIGIAVLASIFMGESLTGLSVVWLINLGRLLEAMTLKRSRTAIKELMDIAPKEAWLVDSHTIVRKVPVETLHKGQIIRIFESEKIPLDGKVISGTGLIQEAFITGEAIPKEKTVGSSAYAGSLVMAGEIDLEITNLAHETVVARIIDAIENVRDSKAPIEKVGAKFAEQFVPISLAVAGIAFLVTGDFRRAITMLVIACPCAAGLATPTAVSASIGQAARKGILIKGGTHIETAAKIDTLVFDKTGTLTKGQPALERFVSASDSKSIEFHEALRIAASAEQFTTHPLGRVLVAESKKHFLPLQPVRSHKNFPGMGIKAELDNVTVHVGNHKFLTHLDIHVPKRFEQEVTRGFEAGESIIYLAIDGHLRGAFLVQDVIREEAERMLSTVKRMGITRVLLASGDQKIAASHVASALGIDEVHAELLPKEKLELITRLKAEGHKVAMIGDGMNDAEALAAADLSIAMGGGRCDVAIEAADITLARNDLALVPEVLSISRRTLKTIYQNFAASVGINAGGLAVSALGQLSPFAAAIVHNASTIAVVLNSLWLGKQVAMSKSRGVSYE